MKTLSNKNRSGKIIFPLLLIATFVLAGTLIFRKTQRIKEVSIFSQQLTIDTVTDSRALGYSGQRKLIKDSQGNIFAGYRKEYQGNTEIFVAGISQNFSGFHISGTQKPIAEIGKNSDQRVPSLAVDGNDTVHVIWYGSDTQDEKNNRQIKYSRKPSSATNWESWRNIAHVDGYDGGDFWQEHPVLLSGKSDILYVVWEGRDRENDKQQIKFSKSENGGSVWTKWKNVAPLSNNTQSRPVLIEDNDGKLFLFIYSSGGQNGSRQILFTSSTDKGENWDSWKSISNPAFDARHISATVDKSGEIYVFWRASIIENGPTQVVYRTFLRDNWSDIKTVFPSNNYQFFSNVGTTQSGGTYVSWMENRDSSEFPQENPVNSFGLVSFLKMGIFQPPVMLSDQSNLFYPNVGEKTDLYDFVPIFYAEQSTEGKFNLNLKFLDSRGKTEEFSEKFGKIWLDFWNKFKTNILKWV